jgi:hypothetical protein
LVEPAQLDELNEPDSPDQPDEQDKPDEPDQPVSGVKIVVLRSLVELHDRFHPSTVAKTLRDLDSLVCDGVAVGRNLVGSPYRWG